MYETPKRGQGNVVSRPGLYGFIISFVALVTLLIVEHLYIGILIDAEIIIAIIIVGFYGILFSILIWSATKTEYVKPSQYTNFIEFKVLTISSNTQ
ncbi:MAG: hypothetical protein ACE5I5_12105 [Candidatus Heimdallarchaeota archaeon]